MNLETWSLLKYDEGYEKLLAILLSLDRIPLSIYFNTGPRHNPNGNHNNRWVPQVVSGDPLISCGWLSVGPSHLSYKFIGNSGSPEHAVSLYTVDTILPFESTLYLRDESEGVTYAVESPTSNVDELDTTGFITTYILIYKGPLPNGEHKRRGACFYATQNDELKFWRTPVVLRKIRDVRRIELVFTCPLRLLEVESKDRAGLDLDRTYTLNSVAIPCQLRIKYGM